MFCEGPRDGVLLSGPLGGNGLGFAVPVASLLVEDDAVPALPENTCTV